MTTTTAWLAPARHLSPESFELYLERQAARGRHVAAINALSPLRLKFSEGAPAQVRYVVDRRVDAPVHYYTSRESNGWEHAGDLGHLHIWRQEYVGERPAGLIGAEAYHRAGLWSVGLAVVAAVSLLAAVALGILAAVDPTASATPQDFWAPAIAFAVIGVVAAVVSGKLGFYHRSPTLAPAPEPVRR